VPCTPILHTLLNPAYVYWSCGRTAGARRRRQRAESLVLPQLEAGDFCRHGSLGSRTVGVRAAQLRVRYAALVLVGAFAGRSQARTWCVEPETRMCPTLAE
jgi:hypothetical protein